MLTVIKRAFTSNLQTVKPVAREAAALQQSGIQNPSLQCYFAWRRSLMVFVVVTTILSAGLSTYREYENDDRPDVFDTFISQITKAVTASLPTTIPGVGSTADIETGSVADKVRETAEQMRENSDADEEPSTSESAAAKKLDDNKIPKTILTQFDDWLPQISMSILALVALLTVVNWTKFGFTFRAMTAAFAFSFLMPILLSFCPWSWWEPETASTATPAALDRIQRVADGVEEGFKYLIALLPNVLSLLPGVQKACVRVKSLLPQSTLPGWMLVSAAPFYGLFLMVICVAVNQIFGSPLVLIALLLLVSSSLIYAIRADAFTRPLLNENDYRKMFSVQRTAGIMTMIAGVLLLYFVQSHDVMGIRLLGFDAKKALILPIDLVEFFLEIIGRAMFMTVFGADVFMSINLAAWKNSQNFRGSPEAEKYDAIMSAVEQAR